MTQRQNALVPQKLELVLYGVLAIFISIAGNLTFFSRQLSLVDDSTEETVVSTIGYYILDAIRFIDAFNISAVSAVFVFWSVVGILALSIIHAVYGVYNEVSQDVKIATKFYHPSNYTNRRFWLHVLWQSILNTALYIIGIFAAFFVAGVLAPIAIKGASDLVSSFALFDVFLLLAALCSLWAGLLLLATCLRLILLRQQIDL